MTHIETEPDRSGTIPTLTPDTHHTVDWHRVKAAARHVVNARTVAAAVAAPALAVVWADKVAEPVTRAASADSAFAIAFFTSGLCAVGIALGGRLQRWALTALLVAAVGGTLAAAPTRHLVSVWIVGA